MSKYADIGYIVQDLQLTPEIAPDRLARLAYDFIRRAPTGLMEYREIQLQTEQMEENKFLYKGDLPPGFASDESVMLSGMPVQKVSAIESHALPGYAIRGNCIYTNFPYQGILAYYVVPLNEVGMPLIWEDAADAFRAYVLWKHNFACGKYQEARECERHYGMALSELRGLIQKDGARSRSVANKIQAKVLR